MSRMESVIAELEAARMFAVTRFASEAGMPVSRFLEHFRVVMERSEENPDEVNFRVEPIEER